MFGKVWDKVRQVMYRMGIYGGIKDVLDKKELKINDEMYEMIKIWEQLYKGYYSEWHDVYYQTIAGREYRRMASMNMPKVVSQEMASLVFNEKCKINISDNALGQEIEKIFVKNNFYREMQKYLEYMFGMGGMVIKPFVENGELKLSYVEPSAFIPISYNNERITECVFKNVFFRQGKKYTLLEWHLWEKDREGGNKYVIKNELYESNDINGDELGVKIPITTFYDNLAERAEFKGYRGSWFVYFKPNTANNIDFKSPLGVPIYANALDTLHSLDIAFDSFQREFRLGKKRIIVPTKAIRHTIDPETGERHRYFDTRDEVYEAFDFENEEQFHDINVVLRVEEHVNAINTLLKVLAMQVGFSPGAFTFDGQGVKTATEVISENSKTFRTKQSHETIIENGIRELIRVIIEVAEEYGIFTVSGEPEVTIEFNDSVAEDKTAVVNRQIYLVTNKLTSLKRAIMKVHGVGEEEAERILQEIREENQTATAEAVDFFGINRAGER